jgi:hypothetical protein
MGMNILVGFGKALCPHILCHSYPANEAFWYFETSVFMYQTALGHKPELRNVYLQNYCSVIHIIGVISSKQWNILAAVQLDVNPLWRARILHFTKKYWQTLSEYCSRCCNVILQYKIMNSDTECLTTSCFSPGHVTSGLSI